MNKYHPHTIPFKAVFLLLYAENEKAVWALNSIKIENIYNSSLITRGKVIRLI